MSDNTQSIGTIHTAINAVMNEVGYVRKSKASSLNYSFAGEAALIAALRPAMVENNIYMHVQEIRDVQEREYATSKGTAMVNVRMIGVVRFTHAPSGTYIDVMSAGEGSDSGDKATNKALTGMYKYALRQTYCIETGDDPDKTGSEARATSQKAAQQNPPANAGASAPEGHADDSATMSLGAAKELLRASGITGLNALKAHRTHLQEKDAVQGLTAEEQQQLQAADLILQ